MGAEAADRADLAANPANLAVELDRCRAGLEVGTEGAHALVADEQDHRARIVDQVAQVADDPAAGQHPVRGDDHVRPGCPSDRLGLLHVVRDRLLGVVERRVAGGQQGGRLGVVVVRVMAVDVARLRGHRRVEVKREQRDPPGVDQAMELPDDILGPPDREGRHEQNTVVLGDQIDGIGEQLVRLGLRFVLATAIRRLDQDVVGIGHDRRVAQDRRAGLAEVAGEDEPELRATLPICDAQSDDRRTEDVAGIDIGRVNAWRNLDLRVVVDPPEGSERGLGVAGVVERFVQVDVEGGRLGDKRLLGVAGDGQGSTRGTDGRYRLRHGDAAGGSAGLPGRLGPGRLGNDQRRIVAAAAEMRGIHPGIVIPATLTDRNRDRRLATVVVRLARGRRPGEGGGRRVKGAADARCGQPLGRGERIAVTSLERPPPWRDLASRAGSGAWRTPPGACPNRAGRGSPARPSPSSPRSGPRKPALTTCGISPQWSRWAWVSRIASSSGRVVGERDPVADRLVRAALEHPAVDQDPGSLRGQQVLRAGHGRRGPEELEVHQRSLPPQLLERGGDDAECCP